MEVISHGSFSLLWRDHGLSGRAVLEPELAAGQIFDAECPAYLRAALGHRGRRPAAHHPAQAAAVEQVDADVRLLLCRAVCQRHSGPVPHLCPGGRRNAVHGRPSGCFCWDWCKRSPSLCGPFSRCWSSRWGWCALCAPAPMGPARRAT